MRPDSSRDEIGLENGVLLDVCQVAQELACSRTYVYDLVARGELVGVKLGRLTRVPRGALSDFIRRKLDESERERHRLVSPWQRLCDGGTR